MPKKRIRDVPGIGLFLGLSFLLSWPLFFWVDVLVLPDLAPGSGPRWLAAFAGHVGAMFGPAIAAMVCWRFVHRERPPRWRWSRGKHYVMSLLAMFGLWVVPALIGWGLYGGWHWRQSIEPFVWILIAGNLTIVWFAGMGEEMGWAAYLLSRLTPEVGPTRALLFSGVVRGLWHWPVLAAPALAQWLDGDKSLLRVVALSVFIAFQLIISNILFGAVFGWLWYRTQSLPLLGWLHQWFDAARDITSLLVVGYGGSLWFKALWGLPFYVTAVFLFLLAVQAAESRSVGQPAEKSTSPA